MDILSAFGINWKILLGQLLNFVILLYLLKKFAYGPFLRTLQQRKKTIEQGVKKSEEIEEKLKAVAQKREEILGRAQEQSLQIMKDTEKKAQEKSKGILLLAEKDKETILKKAIQDGQDEIAKMKEAEKQEVIDLILSLAEKILKEKIDRVEDKKLIQKFLSQITYEKS